MPNDGTHSQTKRTELPSAVVPDWLKKNAKMAKDRPTGNRPIRVLCGVAEGVSAIGYSVTGDTKFAGLTARTEHSTRVMMASAVFPMNNPCRPARPSVPMINVSMRCSCA